MPAGPNLLAHLVPRFTDRVEDIAVEALGYILSESPTAIQVLNEALWAAAADLVSISRVQTQVVGEGGSRPDLVGFDEGGDERLLIEAKFWASLTENQPGAYLDRLPKSGSSVLLFIAPGARVETLWTELLRRLNELGVELLPGQTSSGIRTCGVSGTECSLMLVSWSFLLDRMSVQTNAVGDTSVEEDIRQLQGLVERQDEHAFLPL